MRTGDAIGTGHNGRKSLDIIREHGQAVVDLFRADSLQLRHIRRLLPQCLNRYFSWICRYIYPVLRPETFVIRPGDVIDSSAYIPNREIHVSGGGTVVPSMTKVSGALVAR